MIFMTLTILVRFILLFSLICIFLKTKEQFSLEYLNN